MPKHRDHEEGHIKPIDGPILRNMMREPDILLAILRDCIALLHPLPGGTTILGPTLLSISSFVFVGTTVLSTNITRETHLLC